jgi:uncharacterized metal-binding protein YceD (DUF177 family)
MAKKGLEYIVEYKSLSTGTYEIDYHLDKEFFSMFPESEFQDGDVDVNVRMDVSLAGLQIEFDIHGTLRCACDRCGEMFDIPVDAQYDMAVKFGTESSNPMDADDTIVLSVDETSIDLSHHIYEYVVLSVPPRRVHPEDENGIPACNPEIVGAIGNLDDDEDYDDDYDDNQESDDDDSDDNNSGDIDPRWEQLRNLL